MGTYYVDNDVGATGGTGTQEDPYGIETAIAAAQAGDVFYWRGGGEGDVSPGHTLDFNSGGTASAPVWWIGTDDSWVPIPPGQMPHTSVDGNDGAFVLVQLSAMYQIFENVRIHNALQGRHGGVVGCKVKGKHTILRNCVVHDCGVGFSAEQYGQTFTQCRSYDVWLGFQIQYVGTGCYACAVNDTESHAYKTLCGMTLIGCRAHDIGGNGIELYADSGLKREGLIVDHFSVYDCVDGVKINAYDQTNANISIVTNCIFDTCSGYAVNVTLPTGQPGVILNNGSRNCSSGQVPAGRTGLINEGWINLPASPFVDAGNGDLALVRSTPAIGAAVDGGDLGAFQRQFVRLPYPAVGLT